MIQRIQSSAIILDRLIDYIAAKSNARPYSMSQMATLALIWVVSKPK